MIDLLKPFETCVKYGILQTWTFPREALNDKHFQLWFNVKTTFLISTLFKMMKAKENNLIICTLLLDLKKSSAKTALLSLLQATFPLHHSF